MWQIDFQLGTLLREKNKSRCFSKDGPTINIHSAASVEGALKQAGKGGKETKTVNSPNAPKAYAMCIVLIAFLASKLAHHLHLRFSTDQCKTVFCKSQA